MASTLAITTAMLGLTTLTTTPAQAASTLLCSGVSYSVCISKGFPDGGYGANSSTSYWLQYPKHNCTNYVAYRLIQNGMSDTKPWTGTGNALTWGEKNASKTDSTPALGSIAWWGKSNTSPLGHVAYVEYVDATQIVVSEDNYGGTFNWRSIPRTSGNSSWPDGFIHFADQTTISETLPVGWIGSIKSIKYWKTDTATTPASTTNLAPGKRIYVTARVLNKGGQTWTDVSLAAVTPKNAVKTIADSTWPTTTSTPIQIEPSVAPGATATIGYWIQVPQTAAAGATIVQSLKPMSATAGWVTSNAKTISLSVKKLKTSATITLSRGLAKKKNSGVITAKLVSSQAAAAVAGNVRVRIDGKKLKLVTIAKAAKGKVVVKVKGLRKGKHTVSVSYGGSASQSKVTKTISFRVTSTK